MSDLVSLSEQSSCVTSAHGDLPTLGSSVALDVQADLSGYEADDEGEEEVQSNYNALAGAVEDDVEDEEPPAAGGIVAMVLAVPPANDEEPVFAAPPGSNMRRRRISVESTAEKRARLA
ncbi:hypothetical protein ACP70R_039385 [Stipagrostis hirtigluma subsp. patula]